MRPHGFKAWLQVVRCYQKGLRRLSERLVALDMTSPQLDVLANLYTGAPEGMTQDELGQRLLVTKGNVSGLVDRLSQKGWVERQPHPEDRRSNLILLTEQGHLVAEQAVAVQNEFVAELMVHLGEDSLQALEGALSRLEQHLDSSKS